MLANFPVGSTCRCAVWGQRLAVPIDVTVLSAAGCTLLIQTLSNGNLVSSCPEKLLGRGYMYWNSCMYALVHMACGICDGDLGLLTLPQYWENSSAGLKGKRRSGFPRGQGAGSLAAAAWQKWTTFGLGHEMPKMILKNIRCSYICHAGYVALWI